MPNWTQQQLEAIEDRGHNLIVCAAAGSGKTAVLVSRIAQLAAQGCPIERMLVVTFTNAARVREAAAAVPRDKLLIETDAPYLAPHPNRGKLNHSGYLTFVLDVLAQIWNCSPEDAALQTYQNAIAFFELP